MPQVIQKDDETDTDVDGIRSRRVSAVRRSTLFIAVSVCLVLGCDGPKTTWSAESRSPDGKMIATADTIIPSGIGTGDFGTRVYLNWTTGPQPKTIILAFLDGTDESDGTNVGMNWLSPTHLELTYKGHRKIDFQAVRCHGVDISVRELPDGTSNAGAQ